MLHMVYIDFSLLSSCALTSLLSHAGYERYNAMRADPALCFLERVGMPDVTALTVEQSGAETASDAPDR